MLYKGEEGTHVSFVVKGGTWNNPAIVANFRALGQRIAPAIGGPPLVVKLRDENLNTKKEIQVE